MTSNNTVEPATQGIGNICHNQEAKGVRKLLGWPSARSRITHFSCDLGLRNCQQNCCSQRRIISQICTSKMDASQCNASLHLIQFQVQVSRRYTCLLKLNHTQNPSWRRVWEMLFYLLSFCCTQGTFKGAWDKSRAIHSTLCHSFLRLFIYSVTGYISCLFSP